MARADIVQKGKPIEYFSDFLNNMDVHPMNKSLGRVINEESIKQSLKNLIMTNIGERLFQPTIGSNVYKSLFEPNDVITAENITYHITSTIKQNEKRVILLNVIVNPNPDTYSFDVNIIFSLINNPDTINLNLILRRVR
jgi:phage baseplate assembly protein W